ncbi:MAG TPA: hypothetical protein VIU46_03230 [Gallionellaceae bacterium]
MSGINLFEQQARLQRQFAQPGRGQSNLAEPSLLVTPLQAVMRFIEGANLEQCGKVAVHLSARLFALEKQHSGMQAANLNEAAHFVADAALDIGGAQKAEDEAPCRCGRCDACVAARSDERHDRRRDWRLGEC